MRFLQSLSVILLGACAVCLPAQQGPPIVLLVDMADADRNLIHVRENLPVHAGENVFEYPQWIPGEHRPSGPIDALAGISFRAAGRPLPWRRDLVDMYAFRVNVPSGIATLDLSFDFLAVPGKYGSGTYHALGVNLAVLEPSCIVMFPSKTPVRDIPVKMTLGLPADWGFGTSLQPIQSSTKKSLSEVDFRTTSIADPPPTMAPAPEQETEEQAQQREVEHEQRMAEYKAEQDRKEEERKAEFERQQQEYEAEQARRTEVRKARLDTFERILASAPVTFTAPQLRVFLAALVNLDPYDFAEDVAAFYAGDDENNQQTPEVTLLSTLTALPDDKLTQFALRLVLTGHTDTPRENDFDYLAQAAEVFETKKPKPSKAKDKPAPKKPIIVKATEKKKATTKKKAA